MLFTNILSPIRQIHRILDEAHESSIKVGDLKKLMNLKKDIVFETKNSKQIKDS
jgi:ATP-binding cassette, subfamily B, bacterial